jgi:O-antigen/teichoic acid export membrane protein
VKALSGFVRVAYAPGAPLVAYKLAADAFSKAAMLMVSVAAARALAPGDFGVFALALTTGWLLGVASDAGLPMYLATRVAQAVSTGGRVDRLVEDVMRWRRALALAAFLAGAGVAAALLPSSVWLPFLLVVVHQLCGAAFETLAHAYRGLGRVELEATLAIAWRAAMTLGALIVLALAPSLTALAIAMLLPAMAALLASHALARRVVVEHRGLRGRVTGVDSAHAASEGRDATPHIVTSRHGAPETRTAGTPDPHASVLDAIRFRADVAPLGLAVLLSALYFRCDVYFLEWTHGLEAVGVYNAAFRIVEALRLFPAAALAVVYPVLCRATDLRPLGMLSGLLGAVSLVMALAVALSAESLLALIYGATFAAGAPALRVLALCIPFFFVNYALTHQVIAWQPGRTYLAIAAAALAVNLAGNAALIPEHGMVGAALSTLITEAVVTGGSVAALAARRR